MSKNIVLFVDPDHGKLDVLGGWVLRLRAVAAEVKRGESLLPAHRRAETATLAAGLEQLYGRLNGDLQAMVVRAGLSRPLRGFSIKR